MPDHRDARVDLRELGRWGRTVRIELAGRWEEVWLQTIGDRTEALERGHEAMQRKLLEFRAGGERAEALTEALLLAPAEDLAELALEAERPQLAARARREQPDPVRPRRDSAAGETEEAFSRRLADHQRCCEGLARTRQQRLDELARARRRELLALPKRELVALARPRRIDIECWNAFARTCDDWVLLRAVRRAEDHSQQYFSDLAEVQALHPEVKEQLRQAYRSLEPQGEEPLPKSSADTGGFA